MLNITRKFLRPKEQADASASWDPQLFVYVKIPGDSPRVEFCGIDVDVVDLRAALELMRHKLVELAAPEGTELHYTVGSEQLLDQLESATWAHGLPRTVKHPYFEV